LLLAEHNYFEPEVARFYVSELILAMEKLHKLGVLYRDLKPENILIDRDGHIKLADFGLSKVLQFRGEFAKSYLGSYIYLSPEMIKKQGYTESSDIYGIGLILYELLFALPPFYIEDLEEMHSKIKSEELTFPWEVSPILKDLLFKLLAKNPSDRLGAKGMSEVKEHPFFEGIDWDSLLNKKIDPPFIIEDEEEGSNRRTKRIIKTGDADYTEENWDTLRVPGYEFVRESEMDTKLNPWGYEDSDEMEF